MAIRPGRDRGSRRTPRRHLRRLRIGAFTLPADAARAADLHHISDARPGIRRHRHGAGFSYRNAEGTPVHDRRVLGRIRALAIPPAWTEVWISPDPAGHLQATGRDARGRKQYRYHPRWRAVRDATKYHRMAAFGAALPAIRKAVGRDLARPGVPREKVMAIVVRLLETTMARIGNEEYARDNGSFGLTTLEHRHVDLHGQAIRFRFRGKGGKVHEIRVADRRLARLVRRCRELPGHVLFQYLDDEGVPHAIDSTDVNAYLRDVSGDDFTAKDFRTWAGTVLAARQLPAAADADPVDLHDAVALVATQLGNTPAVCRRCYIHPAVLEAFDDPARRSTWCAALHATARRGGLTGVERALVRFVAMTGAQGVASATA
ncbi:MAG: DNA topoisomerase IB [Gemmatimonadales bacterium]